MCRNIVYGGLIVIAVFAALITVPAAAGARVWTAGYRPAESDLAVLEADQTVIGYGDAVRIAAEIIQDLIRAAEGRLRIDHPLDFAAACERGFESFLVGQWLKGAPESELAGGVGLLSFIEAC